MTGDNGVRTNVVLSSKINTEDSFVSFTFCIKTRELITNETSGRSSHSLMYGIGRAARRSEASGKPPHSHLGRLMHESVVKGEDDPTDEVCCDKS